MSARRNRRPTLRTSWRTVLASGGSLLLTWLLLRRWSDRAPESRPHGDKRTASFDLSTLPDWSEPELEEVEPERRDVRVGRVLLAGVALVIFGGLVLAVVTGIQFLAAGRPPNFLPPRGGPDDPPVAQAPNGVVEEGIPGQALQSVRATEAALLNGYGWIDQSAGVVRLPIERAMQLVVQRGLPLQPGAEARDFRTYGNSVPLDSSSGRKSEAGGP